VFLQKMKNIKEDQQKFKDDHIGRIVIAVGKIATDTNNNDPDTEWQIKYDKEGITIEDALPIIELAAVTNKDKRVFGVLGVIIGEMFHEDMYVQEIIYSDPLKHLHEFSKFEF
jgi:hypothetical protein